MDHKVKITPRIGTGVARRLRLAAGLGPRSMSALVDDALDRGPAEFGGDQVATGGSGCGGGQQ